MVAVDETALICDMAEIYHVLDWRSLPARTAAALAAGLGEESRIKMKLAGSTVPVKTMLLAGILDRLSILCWRQTVDGQKGENPPESVFRLLSGQPNQEQQCVGFDTSEEYDAWRSGFGEVKNGD